AVDRLADETAGLLAQEDLAGLGRLLEASSHIDGVPGCQALLGAGHDLAGVDADAQLEARSVRALELIVEVAEAGAQLVGGRRGLGQRRAARVAEARALTVLRPTARAAEHGASVTSRNAGDLRARSRQPLGPRTGALIHERGAAPARLARPLRGAPLARRDCR